jgi:hypothetical protein
LLVFFFRYINDGIMHAKTMFVVGLWLAAGTPQALETPKNVTFSRDNKWNPDPAATVRWGDESWEEMLTCPMAVIVDRTVDPRSVIVRGPVAPGRVR